MLLYLRDVLTIGYVPRLLVFSVVDLVEFRDTITDRISNEFEGQLVAVRSSADDEDQIGSSSAGKYHSVLSVDACDKQQVNKALDDVISSYKNLVPQGNEASVIVQEMVTDVTMSGVIFSYHLSNSAPYYVINYDDMSGRTDTVTSGSTKHSNRSLYVYRSKSNHVRSARFVSLLKAMEELESKLESKSLDVEFAISGKSHVAILQARQIINTSEISNENMALLDKTLLETELDLSRYFVKQKKQLGNFPILGQMPDWNPAEMIGRLPHNLSRSLYEVLITNKSWHSARGRMG
jgi:phosphoenolpyruvate synthase/pyruvate phosphate dikinase